MAKIASSYVVNPATLGAEAKEKLIDALYAAHCDVFDGVARASFVKYVIDSPARLTRIKVMLDAQGMVAGYCAVHFFDRELHGRPCIVTRAEAGLRRAFRGNNAPGAFMVREVLAQRLLHPSVPMYYLGSLVHPSSYAAFARNATGFWPRCEEPTPAAMLEFMGSIADSFGLERVDPARPLVRKVGWVTRETEGERRFWQRSDRPAARYFLEENPGYTLGHGLVTLVPLTLENLGRSLKQFSSSRLRRGVHAMASAVHGLGLRRRLPAERTLDALQRCALFKTANGASLDRLITGGELMRVRPGQVIFSRGDVAEAMYVVLEGGAQVLLEQDGCELVIDQLSRDEAFGEQALLMDGVRSATVRAATASILLRISYETLRRAMERDRGLLDALWGRCCRDLLENTLRGVEHEAAPALPGRSKLPDGSAHTTLSRGSSIWIRTGGSLFVASGHAEIRQGDRLFIVRGPALIPCGTATRVLAHSDLRLVMLSGAGGGTGDGTGAGAATGDMPGSRSRSGSGEGTGTARGRLRGTAPALG